MRLTLKNIRLKKGWSLENAAKLYNMSVKRLKEIEEYKDVPDFLEVRTMLKMLGFYYTEVVAIIYDDISQHYGK